MSLKSVLQLSAVGAGIVLLLAALAGLAYMNRPPTLTEKVVAYQAQQYAAQVYMGAGCAAAGAKDPNFAPALMQSHGMVCGQVIGRELHDISEGRGLCKIDDKKCLFTVAFVLTKLRVSGTPADTSEDVDAISSEMEDAYNKINEAKESK